MNKLKEQLKDYKILNYDWRWSSEEKQQYTIDYKANERIKADTSKWFPLWCDEVFGEYSRHSLSLKFTEKSISIVDGTWHLHEKDRPTLKRFPIGGDFELAEKDIKKIKEFLAPKIEKYRANERHNKWLEYKKELVRKVSLAYEKNESLEFRVSINHWEQYHKKGSVSISNKLACCGIESDGSIAEPRGFIEKDNLGDGSWYSLDEFNQVYETFQKEFPPIRERILILANEVKAKIPAEWFEDK